MSNKVLGFLQKRLSNEEMERLNIVQYPDRVALLSMMTFTRPPTSEQLEKVAEKLADMAAMYCRENGINEVLIGGANYLTPFLAHALMERALLPVFLWMDRKLKAFREMKNGNMHGEYIYFAGGFVKPYTWDDITLLTQQEDHKND